jgi:hypothetical protein
MVINLTMLTAGIITIEHLEVSPTFGLVAAFILWTLKLQARCYFKPNDIAVILKMNALPSKVFLPNCIHLCLFCCC